MGSFWAVACYFNPLGWESRRRNYRCFRHHLGIPLLTVEWHPEGKFQLGPDDADLSIRICGGDLMWQKERLLNLALARLPAEVEFVAWIDCDVIFCDPDWGARALEALETHRAIQLFSEVRYLGPRSTRALQDGGANAVGARLGRPPDAAAAASAGRVLRALGPDRFVEAHILGSTGGCMPPSLRGNPGMAWAARRSTLGDVPFFDRAIVGSGDWFWILAALGRSTRWLASAKAVGCSYLARSSYVRWAESAHAAIGGRVGFLDQRLLHLYHGAMGDRRHEQRHRAFDRLAIDIDRDVAPVSPGGPWAFVRPVPEWREFMEAYFRGRNEDSAETVAPRPP